MSFSPAIAKTIRTETHIAAPPEQVWDAIRDVGAPHIRLAPGFVVDTRMEEGARIVTFASGLVAREVILGLDDTHRRLAYSAAGGAVRHHAASMEVVADGAGSR